MSAFQTDRLDRKRADKIFVLFPRDAGSQETPGSFKDCQSTSNTKESNIRDFHRILVSSQLAWVK